MACCLLPSKLRSPHFTESSFSSNWTTASYVLGLNSACGRGVTFGYIPLNKNIHRKRESQNMTPLLIPLPRIGVLVCKNTRTNLERVSVLDTLCNSTQSIGKYCRWCCSRPFSKGMKGKWKVGDLPSNQLEGCSILEPPRILTVFKYSGIQKNKRGIPVQIEFLLYI